MPPHVVSTHLSPTHSMSKPAQLFIRLIEGLGVEGDAHAGTTVKHLSRVRRDPTAPNLRQVHLIHAELHNELRAAGFQVSPGQMGENITTCGLDLLALPTGTRLRFGARDSVIADQAAIELTGLRNPCSQLDGIQCGLMAATLGRDDRGGIIRKAGVMAIVIRGGEVRPGDAITVEWPAETEPRRPLVPV